MASRGIGHKPVSPGRPRAVLDEVLILGLAAMGWGYKRVAAEYTRRPGQYVSHSAIRARLVKAGKPRDESKGQSSVTA